MQDQTSLEHWFCSEVLPLEPVLMRLITRYWREPGEAADIRQDVYERVLIGAGRARPHQSGPYLFAVARNVLLNRIRRAKIVSIDLIAELDDVAIEADWLTPERHVDARRQLRRVVEGINRLPERCRQVMMLRKMEGLSTREVAARMGVGTDAVEQQTVLGMRALTDFMLGGEGRIRRRTPIRRQAADRGGRDD